MNELMIFALSLPIGLIIGFGVRHWMKRGLTPTEKAAKMMRLAERNDRAAWDKFIKEFNRNRG